MVFVFLLFNSFVFSQKNLNKNKTSIDIKLGAYYFDGWTGTYPYHITKELTDDYSEREPKWGWITSSQVIMDEQIELAAKSGLSFFNFCWYYRGESKYKAEPLNDALNYYLASKNNNLLEHTIIVVNSGGATIGPAEWKNVCKEWIKLFKSNSYLKVDEKPLITFFSLNSLLEKFQTTENVNDALNQLRSLAVADGLKGVSVAIVLGPDKKDIEQAERCGFNILTGYNYHSSGFSPNMKINPIEYMQKNEVDIWNHFFTLTKLPYIPVSTINWDPRPWANDTNKYATAPYFKGFSNISIYNSVFACKKWILANTEKTAKEKIGIIYAWNEYGEGAYLTPTKNGFNPLEGVEKALRN